jgi:hypothetical protein
MDYGLWRKIGLLRSDLSWLLPFRSRLIIYKMEPFASHFSILIGTKSRAHRNRFCILVMIPTRLAKKPNRLVANLSTVGEIPLRVLW